MRQLMDEHIAQEVRETEYKLKLMERDAIQSAFYNEFRAIETKIWAKVRSSKMPLRDQTVQYVRQQIEQRRIALEQKYRKIGELIGEKVRQVAIQSLENDEKQQQQQQKVATAAGTKSSNPTDNDILGQPVGGFTGEIPLNETKKTSVMRPPSPLQDLDTFKQILSMAEQEEDSERKRAYDHLLQYMNRDYDQHFVNDPFFIGLSQAFEKATGETMDVEQMKAKVTESDLDQFFKMLEGREGREMEERMNAVLSDKTLKDLGIDPSEFNPEALSKAKINHGSSASSSSSSGASAQNNQNQKQGSGASASASASDTTDNFNFSGDRIEDIKYMMKKELERNPGLDKMLEAETGSSMEAIFEDFEEALKSGQLFQSMSNADRVMLANALDFNEMRATISDVEPGGEHSKQDSTNNNNNHNTKKKKK